MMPFTKGGRFALKTIDIRAAEHVRLSGRFDPAQPGFPMMWTAACAGLMLTGSELWAQIQCSYEKYKPYLSFEVDGLRAQTFAPIQGTHWYNVMLGMDASKAHRVRITLESQAFSGDPASYAALLALRFDGEFQPLPEPECKLEFVGDSLTSGEGLRGPKGFMEWVPMCFSASDGYARLVSDRLKAQYQVVSQSGWGVMRGWDGNPRTTLPKVYDSICMPHAMDAPGGLNHGGEKQYDFQFGPDAVIVNLGSNDSSALSHNPFIDPATGETATFTLEDLPQFEDECFRFLSHLHDKNPRARLLWAYGICGDELTAPIQAAVKRARAAGIPAEYLALPRLNTIRGGMGSRNHPGAAAQKRMADLIVGALRR
jgi:lysophospholipase L1-like esterase